MTIKTRWSWLLIGMLDCGHEKVLRTVSTFYNDGTPKKIVVHSWYNCKHCPSRPDGSYNSGRGQNLVEILRSELVELEWRTETWVIQDKPKRVIDHYFTPSSYPVRVTFNWFGPIFEKREQVMSDRLRRAEVLRAQADKLEEEEALRSMFGQESDYEDGCIIYFERTFNYDYGKPYGYAALKAGGFWFVTGRAQKGYRIGFDDLVDEFLLPSSREGLEIYIVTKMERLV